MRQPMIPSMTRLSCGTIRCQINGTYVPVTEFELAAGDWIYFSPKVLLWTDPATTLTIPQPSEVSYGTMAAEREYPTGRYLLSLTAAGRQGLVLLHASGDAFTRDLADSESILMSPASLLYWQDTVDLSLPWSSRTCRASMYGASSGGPAESG